MRITTVAVTFILAGFAMMPGARIGAAAPAGYGDPAGKTNPLSSFALEPVSLFSAADIPEAEPGKPAWLPGKAWCYGIAYYDKWVYAVSRAEYILQFERDPATAKLTYQGATPFAGYHSDEKSPNIVCGIRRLNDGKAMLTILDGNDSPGWWYPGDKGGFIWYSIDKETGKLTAAGKQVPARFDKHNAQQLWAPDQQRFCIGGYGWTKIYWYRFAEDGAPVEDGSFTLKNWPNGNFPGSSVRLSPDWRHLYHLAFQWSEDPLCDKTPQIDTYEIDPKTNAETCVSSLELPYVGTRKDHVSGAIEPVSPDGKHLYVIFEGGATSYYYVLARDPNNGKLTIIHQGTEASLRVAVPWSRMDRLAFSSDGKSGYYISGFDRLRGGPLGRFARDSATGALTILPPVADLAVQKLIVDPANGNMFTVGENISSFKIPAPVSAAVAK